jgi:coenzyme F420-dependent glucose-6-phosphate dehydrogenase
VSGVRHHLSLAHEQFPPDALLRQAVLGERAGFDGICCSDHYQPWWTPGESGHAWAWLGAAGAMTERASLGTAVTAPVHRYHPAVVAQAFATLEIMFPGRVYLGIGSGESLNETPCGMLWPEPAEQLARMDEALEIIGRLLAGEVVDHDGEHFRTVGARLHSRPSRRVPLYVSAFNEGAAEVAARRGDGLWTMADPQIAEPVIEAYREERARLGRDEGEVLLQAGFSWAADDEAALAGASVWKAALVPEFFTDDWHDPDAMQRHAQETVSDDDLREGFIVSSDLGEHVERIREVERLGATTVVLMNVSGADPEGAIAAYGEGVLPALRGAAVR